MSALRAHAEWTAALASLHNLDRQLAEARDPDHVASLLAMAEGMNRPDWRTGPPEPRREERERARTAADAQRAESNARALALALAGGDGLSESPPIERIAEFVRTTGTALPERVRGKGGAARLAAVRMALAAGGAR